MRVDERPMGGAAMPPGTVAIFVRHSDHVHRVRKKYTIAEYVAATRRLLMGRGRVLYAQVPSPTTPTTSREFPEIL